MTSFYAANTSKPGARGQPEAQTFKFYSLTELGEFSCQADGRDKPDAVEETIPRTSKLAAAEDHGKASRSPMDQPSFYGAGPRLNLRNRQPSSGPRTDESSFQRDNSERPGRAAEEENAVQKIEQGQGVSMLPRRPSRSVTNRALDKDIAARTSANEVFELVFRQPSVLDAANWSNFFYSLAHFKKGRDGPDGAARNGARGFTSPTRDARWLQVCQYFRPLFDDLTARDSANVLWSLATLDSRDDPLLLEVADSLFNSGKLAVCDAVSVSKAAWALTAVPNRDRRLGFFDHLSVPVVLRAESYPLGALTMTCYAFAKADHRNADVYEAFSCALERQNCEELRPIDVCNVVWSFCTVGYRDDALFSRLCDVHLKKPEVVKNFNPQDLTNTTWAFCKVTFIDTVAMDTLARAGMEICDQFKAIHFANFFYSFAMMKLRGPDGFLQHMADKALGKIKLFDSGNLAIMVWALATLREPHCVVDAALDQVRRPEICSALTSRARSMLFLAYFRFGRPGDVDSILDATYACGSSVGASGYSAAVMTAEQGPDAEREFNMQLTMANEADDDRMWTAIGNSIAVRLWKRGRPNEAVRFLQGMKAKSEKRWSSVSASLLARLADVAGGETTSSGTIFADVPETWHAPVKSGIHPIAATRQNEGPHAYTREFMTLQAVLCGAPQGDVDACMMAIEQFSESRSLWLKITAWEKAVVVHEVARLAKPRIVVEIGGYVGYSAMNLARAVRPHGGRVVSLEVDPMHVTIVRNMVEYAGVSDYVDVYTGYCYDSIPHLLDLYGPRSIDMVFMDQKGTRFHTDMGLLKELDLLADGAVILADNVLKPGAPHYIWDLVHGPYRNVTAVSVREFLLQSEDWMVMGFHDASGPPVATPPPMLNRVAFESDAFRRRSMFDSIAPNKQDWWAFSQRFIDGLSRSGCKPDIVGLHGRDNPVIQPRDIAEIFRKAGRLPNDYNPNEGKT